MAGRYLEERTASGRGLEQGRQRRLPVGDGAQPNQGHRDKLLLKAALTDQINDREVYMKGVDASYRYEGYNTYKTGDI